MGTAARWRRGLAGTQGAGLRRGEPGRALRWVALRHAIARSMDYPCQAYSRDGGHTWTPRPMRPTGRGPADQAPSRANFVRKFANGKFLYWFHNHGGEPVRAAPGIPTKGATLPGSPGGVEKDGLIHWSEPEILLYDDDPATRMSYPDFIEDGGRYFVTETQKTIARVHEIDPTLLEAVWNHDKTKQVARDGAGGGPCGGDPIPAGHPDRTFPSFRT